MSPLKPGSLIELELPVPSSDRPIEIFNVNKGNSTGRVIFKINTPPPQPQLLYFHNASKWNDYVATKKGIGGQMKKRRKKRANVKEKKKGRIRGKIKGNNEKFL
jgi:hypothetical protein